MDRWLIAGLGNPGPEYAGNRHNAGFMVLDELAARAGGRFKAHKSRAEVCETREAILAKPLTYMNLSGGPVKALSDFYKIGPERLIVVHDELDVPYGALRAKLGGGDNGHNGLKSITKVLGTRDYLRVRFGIGRPPGRMDPAAYVLRDFATAERKDLPFLVDRAADVVESLMTRGLDATQNDFHRADLHISGPPR
ncbi:aminoacyl-tRNA hydrolase [Nonomuraea sp. KC401]|uniref:Peptidyl-tRNA hydrolase n=2 Tax=Nonomuraea TaxID=83681 RepID=A0A4R4MZR1_9ACTN|nr:MULTISPECIES: aminoacyl-tRNA hydrolase [Nonomuraea]NBE93667.1 aminoacyl-tRNA hydrolase [Nonomuraea sp. K271]TDC00974.1 aminoacyl-tRNA hydrolase [Nonomuraea longispora]TDE40464.1 aminoacyl-tRNA hydrolase [Nonomuraea mesophila]TLF85286.1 aminoacyl-tRNA hydrolase [Nonomuraea sp. KC401]